MNTRAHLERDHTFTVRSIIVQAGTRAPIFDLTEVGTAGALPITMLTTNLDTNKSWTFGVAETGPSGARSWVLTQASKHGSIVCTLAFSGALVRAEFTTTGKLTTGHARAEACRMAAQVHDTVGDLAADGEGCDAAPSIMLTAFGAVVGVVGDEACMVAAVYFGAEFADEAL